MNIRRFVWPLVFFIFWVILVFIDQRIISADYRYLPHDNDLGWFGMGLNWKAFHPTLVFHHPSLLINQISGLLVALVDLDWTGQAVRDFQLLGLVVHVMIVLMAGRWFAWATDEIGLDTVSRAILVVLTFTFPPLLLYAAHWGNYFALSVLGLPLGVTIFLAIVRNHARALAVSGAGLGAMLANFYPVAALLGALGIALAVDALRRNGIASLRPKMPTLHPFDYWSSGMLGVCTLVAAPVASLVIFDGRFFIVSLLVGGAAWLVSLVAYLYATQFDARFRPLLGWAAIGFVIGAGILLPSYPVGLLAAGFQATRIASSVSEPFALIAAYPWLLIYSGAPVFLAVAAGLMLVRRCSQAFETPDLATLLIFSTLSIVMIGLAAGGWLQASSISGLGERLFTAALPALIVGWLAVFSIFRRRTARMIQLALLVLSAIVVSNFYAHYGRAVEMAQQTGAELEVAVESFLHDSPNGLVICARDDYPIRYCAAAYAYNVYRTPGSVREQPTRHLFGDKVLWIKPEDSRGEIAELLAAETGRAVLIIGHEVYRAKVVGFFMEAGAHVAVNDTGPIPLAYVSGYE